MNKLKAEKLSSIVLPRGAFIFMDAGSSETILNGLTTKLQGIQDQLEALVNAADADDRDLTDDELEQVEEFKEQIEKTEKQIKARESLKVASKGRKSTAEPESGRDTRRVTDVRPKDSGKWGFKSFGEFAMTVRQAGGTAPQAEAVQRMSMALTTYANEGTGSDGGYLVPPDFRTAIAQKVLAEDQLISRTDQQTTSSNSMVIPTDETTPWGTSGVQAYWEAEAGQKTQSKPVFGQNTLRLNKLIALVPVTDEMLQDAPQIDGYLRRKVPEVMTSKLNTALLFGSGAGQPLGMLHASNAALITVAKETSQAADTILFENIVKMYARMSAASISRAIWLVNQSIFPQLILMRFDNDAASPVPVYLPGGNIAGAPFGTLLGRPVVPMEAMKTLGDLGDIAFVDPAQYLTLTKGGVQTDISIHLFFDYDITAFRFVFRVSGQPWWKSAITPQAAGAPTLGHFITLAERA